MFKSYALSIERSGVIVAPISGTLKLDEAAGLAILDLGSADLAKLLASKGFAGVSKVSVVNGEDETTTHQITVTGMAVGDEVVQVLVFTTAASIATLAAHAGTFTAASGKITPGTEVDNTGNKYVVVWNDLT